MDDFKAHKMMCKRCWHKWMVTGSSEDIALMRCPNCGSIDIVVLEEFE